MPAYEDLETRQPTVVLRPGVRHYELQEAFKTLRTNIEFCGDNVRVICVTSALPGDGKSTVSYNLARAFAESGCPTLLIDADLRKSVMRKKICRSGNTGYGLTYYLVGRRTLEEIVCVTDCPNLSVVFSGTFPPNPSELLGSSRFAELIESVRSQYSVVIIDTPPIGSVIDAAIVARECDGSVLVLKDSAISYGFAQRCKEQLEASKSPILGCVLNDVERTTNRYYHRYYKAYGDYYGGSRIFGGGVEKDAIPLKVTCKCLTISFKSGALDAHQDAPFLFMEGFAFSMGLLYTG